MSFDRTKSRVGLECRRRVGPWLAAVMVAAAVGIGSSAPTKPTVKPSTKPATKPAAKPVVTDAAVAGAIAKGLAWLEARQTPDGAVPNRHSAEYAGGGEALAALAWLEAGLAHDRKPLAATLGYLGKLDARMTYVRALRAMVYVRLGADGRRGLAEDARWLVAGQLKTGGWGYGSGAAMTRLNPKWADGSNSYFALLALHEAADAGIEIPPAIWPRAEKYWRSFRNSDGGWGYRPAEGDYPNQRVKSYGYMTTAGAAAQLILIEKFSPALAGELDAALKWLAQYYRVDRIPKHTGKVEPSQLHCYLWALARLGQDAGLRRLGRHDYNRDIAAALLASQGGDGGWRDSPIDTALAVLCLQTIHTPVLINRLRLSSGPAGADLAAANVTGWLSRRVGRSVGFQEITAKDAAAFAQAPILYVDASGGERWPAALDKPLAQFIRNGGTCVIQAPPEGAFTERFAERCLRLFPGYRRAELPADHPLFSAPYPLPSPSRPRVIGIGDGCRARVIILLDDIAGAWRTRRGPSAFPLAGNIAYYATAGALPRGRFAAVGAQESPPPARTTIPIARLKYAGDYGVCGGAAQRLSTMLARSRSIGIQELPAADPARPIDARITMLWLTGNTPPKFSPAELVNIRRYVRNGGTLLIDPATGRQDFRAAAAALTGAMFGRGALRDLRGDDPLITGQFGGGIGADVSQVRLLRRPGAKLPLGRDAWLPSAGAPPARPALSAIRIDGRAAIILSAYGLSCSVEAAPCVENLGYRGHDARRIVLNVLLYAATGR